MEVLIVCLDYLYLQMIFYERVKTLMNDYIAILPLLLDLKQKKSQKLN